MGFKEDAKQWFETGDYPTQAQFAQVFEWLRWKDEQQAISTITGLADILNSMVPEGQLPVYENMAAAIAGGLADGKKYRVPYNNGNYLVAIVVLGSIPANALLNEDGTPLLNEDGTILLAE